MTGRRKWKTHINITFKVALSLLKNFTVYNNECYEKQLLKKKRILKRNYFMLTRPNIIKGNRRLNFVKSELMTII